MALQPIQSVQITITKVDGTTETFTLAQPNSDGENIFKFGFRRVPLRGNYRDNNLRLQKSEELYRFVAQYSYESHEMDLRPIYLAKEIELKVPPVFNNTGSYQTFDVRLKNDEILRDYVTDIPGEGDLVQPSGPVELRFEGVKEFEWNEIKGIIWFQPIKCPSNVQFTTRVTEIDVTWDNVSGADGYNVYVDGTKDNDSLINSSPYTIDSLEGDTTYDIKVTAVQGGVESLGCPVNSVTTETAYEEDLFYAFGTGSDNTVRKAKMDGTVIWSKPHNGDDEDITIDSNPEGELLVADADGNVVKYDKDGNKLWSFGTSDASAKACFAADGEVMVVGNHVNLYRLDSDGNLVNSADLTQISSYSSVNDYHIKNFLIDENKVAYFYNGNENDLVEIQFNLSSASIYSVFSGDVLQGVVCGDDEGYLYAAAYGNFGKMDKQGNVIWTNGLNGKVTACCYYNDHIYVGDDSDHLYAVDKSGNVIDSIKGNPLAVARTINMVVSQNAELYLGYDGQNSVQQVLINDDGTLGTVSTASGIPGADVITKGGHFLPFKESL